MNIKIKDLTFGELREYTKINCPFSDGKMKIEIMGYNSYPNSTECICGLPTNDARSIILQGDSDMVLEQEIEFDKKQISLTQLQFKETELDKINYALSLAIQNVSKDIDFIVTAGIHNDDDKHEYYDLKKIIQEYKNIQLKILDLKKKQ